MSNPREATEDISPKSIAAFERNLEWAFANSRAVPRIEASQLVEGWIGKSAEDDLLTIDNFHVEYAVQWISRLDQPLMSEGIWLGESLNQRISQHFDYFMLDDIGQSTSATGRE